MILYFSAKNSEKTPILTTKSTVNTTKDTIPMP